MKKKLYSIGVLLGMLVLLGVYIRNNHGVYDTKAVLGSMVGLNDEEVTETIELRVSKVLLSKAEELKVKIIEVKEEEKRLELEKAKAEELAVAPVEWTKHYGSYRIMQFLPTISYPFQGSDILPVEEARLMTRKFITISEDLFVIYDNYRQPDSEDINHQDGDYWLDKVEIENPDYQIKNVWVEENFGVQDDMFPRELKSSKYMEIDVYPGYDRNGSNYVPHLYLADDGRIILSAMEEFFLLEKMEIKEQSAGNKDKSMELKNDLSDWTGKYSYSESSTTDGYAPMIMNYQIDLYENELGEYYADIFISGQTTLISIRAEVNGDSKRISLVFERCLPGNMTWEDNWTGVLLRFQRDGDEIYTYWEEEQPMFYENMEPGVYFVKE